MRKFIFAIVFSTFPFCVSAQASIIANAVCSNLEGYNKVVIATVSPSVSGVYDESLNSEGFTVTHSEYDPDMGLKIYMEKEGSSIFYHIKESGIMYSIEESDSDFPAIENFSMGKCTITVN